MDPICLNCEHTGGSHSMGFGRCEGDSYDPDYGTYRCMCPKFERDFDQ
jgi:hypothetical protein